MSTMTSHIYGKTLAISCQEHFFAMRVINSVMQEHEY